MSQECVGIRGCVHLQVIGPDGSTVGEARATNTVVDGGRQLIAQLLAGVASSPVFQLTAGVEGMRETSPEMQQLYNVDGLTPVDVTEISAVGGEVRLKGAFPRADRDRTISEVGLILACTVNGEHVSRLYNRAKVEPAQVVRAKEVLTMSWTLTFAPQAAQG